MLTHLNRKLERRDRLDPSERQALEQAVSEVREFRARQVVVPEGVIQTESNLLLSGFVCRYKDMPDGRRQILELHVAGDFVDLHSFVLKKLEHNIASLTPVRIAIVPHAALTRITEDHPHLARLLWFSTLLDAAIHREWLLSIGRRSAVGRLAHLVCELWTRLDILGLTTGYRFELPLTQVDIGDAIGITNVHVNRMLQQLRGDGLLSYRDGIVEIMDWNGLKHIAEFNADYLYLEARSR